MCTGKLGKNVVSGLESGEHSFATPVVYQHGSSHISGGAIGSGMTGSDRVRTRNRFPRFFLTIVVVQNVSLRITGSNMATRYDVTECHVTRRDSLEGYAHVHPEVAQYPP
jgi:hypothetical protein